MNKLTINTQTVERVYDINGVEFKTYLTDSKIKEIFDYMDIIAKVEEGKEEEALELVFKFINALFGEGSSDKLYKAAGFNTFNLSYIIEQILEDITKSIVDLKEYKLNKYL